MKNLPEGLKTTLPNLVFRENISWKAVSTLGVGSDISLLAEPSDDIELVKLLKYCRQESIPVKTIGAGSNLVGCDTPFEGVIIRLLHNCFSKVVYGSEADYCGKNSQFLFSPADCDNCATTCN